MHMYGLPEGGLAQMVCQANETTRRQQEPTDALRAVGILAVYDEEEVKKFCGSAAKVVSRQFKRRRRAKRILTLNSGSSSLKFALFGENHHLEFSGNLSGIGSRKAGKFSVEDGGGETTRQEELRLSDHHDATTKLMEWLAESVKKNEISAVGHRIVHGGSKHVKPQIIDEAVIDGLNKLKDFAPLHLPSSIDTLKAARSFLPDAPHVACFDTSFHRRMPNVAKVLPLTRELFESGVERFGFHGLSYEYVMSELRSSYGGEFADSRLIIAHLGNGCSMAAVHHGVGLDTTMAFSPAGGLVMGTRSGDIDAGLITYFCDTKGYSPKEFVDLVNHKSGLLGLSGLSSDMQVLLSAEGENEHAKLAIDIFCYSARKFIAALSAVLGGIDALVFTGGIGENSDHVRSRICDGLEFLGIEIDQVENRNGKRDISTGKTSVRTLVIKTNEELMIARHCREVLDGMTPGAEGDK